MLAYIVYLYLILIDGVEVFNEDYGVVELVISYYFEDFFMVVDSAVKTEQELVSLYIYFILPQLKLRLGFLEHPCKFFHVQRFGLSRNILVFRYKKMCRFFEYREFGVGSMRYFHRGGSE